MPPIRPSRLAVLAWVALCGCDATHRAGNDAGPEPDAGVLIQTVVRVRYPSAGHTMSVRGSRAPLSWDGGLAMTLAAPDTFELTVAGLVGDVELKPLLDDQTWAKGPNWTVTAGATTELVPRFLRDRGEASRRWPDFASALLGNTRGVWVYLPPTLLENPAYRAPVAYLQDGQNLFDPAFAFGGVAWRVAETMDAAAVDGSIREAIIIGPENAGGARLDEYTPTADPQYGGGRGDLYLRMLVEELKPKVDAEFRTRPEKEATLVLGSSLGGLLATYAGARRPDVFGLVGAMSPSTWWDSRMILDVVKQLPPAPARPLKVYVDVGDLQDGQADTDDLATAFRARGYVDGQSFEYVVQHGASHSERYWAERLPGALRFLLGPMR